MGSVPSIVNLALTVLSERSWKQPSTSNVRLPTSNRRHVRRIAFPRFNVESSKLTAAPGKPPTPSASFRSAHTCQRRYFFRNNPCFFRIIEPQPLTPPFLPWFLLSPVLFPIDEPQNAQDHEPQTINHETPTTCPAKVRRTRNNRPSLRSIRRPDGI